MTNHPNRKKTYPDHTLEDAARKAGATVCVLWETRGPKGTCVDWMVGYAIGNSTVIVQTYTDGNGWNAFVASPSIDTSKTIADVFERCGVRVPALCGEPG